MTFFVISNIEKCKLEGSDGLYTVTYEAVNTISEHIIEVDYTDIGRISIGLILPILDTRDNVNKYITFEDEFYFDYESLKNLN